MKIRKETDYAIRAIRALARADGIALMSREIGEKEAIPQTYILSIMCKLKAAGIASTIHKNIKRKGGYILAADLDRVTLYDVVYLFEGDIKINTCLREEDDCPNRSTCTIHNEMLKINDELIQSMKRRSLNDILNEQFHSEMGTQKDEPDTAMQMNCSSASAF